MNRKVQAILKIIFILVVVIIFLRFCLVFLWPFFISVLIVFLIEPLIKQFMKILNRRKISVIISFVVVLFFLGLSLFYLSSYAYASLFSFFHKLPEIFSIIGEKFDFINSEKINYTSFINTIENVVLGYKDRIAKTLLSTVNGIIYFIIISMTSFFISMDLKNLLDGVKRIIPKCYYNMLYNVVNKMISIVMLEVKLVVASTVQTVLGLYVLGIEDTLTIGIICGILDILPIVGPSIIFIPWIAYEFIITNYFLAFGLLCLYLLLQINREIMHIRFVGGNLKIHPVITIFSLYIGIILFGIWGVILGPLLIILIQELFKNLYEGRSQT